MAVTLNLVSEKNNIINDFLTSFFEKEMLTDNTTKEWSYVLPDPLNSIELISALIDNYSEEDVSCWISFDTNVFIKVKNENYNEIIKYILNRFGKIS